MLNILLSLGILKRQNISFCSLKSTSLARLLPLNNEEKSPASFCHQMAARFPDMFCNFYLVKNHEIAKNSTTTKAR
jgi:hypothetical protein